MDIETIFKGQVNRDFKTQKPVQQNLSCICLNECKKYVYILAYSKITNIETCIRIDKKDKIISIIHPQQVKKYQSKKKKFYSLFLGVLTFQNQNYLLFAKDVKYVPFFDPEISIFEIKSVTALQIDTLSKDQFLDDGLNIIYKDGFLFSYDFDMTRKYNNQSKNYFRSLRNPLWLYYTNVQMHKPFLRDKCFDWLIPVIYGSVIQKSLNFSKEIPGKFYFIHRASIIDFLDELTSMKEFRNITVSNQYQNFDFFLVTKTNQCSLNICLTNLPTNLKDKQLIQRFFDFANQNFFAEQYFCLNFKQQDTFDEYFEVSDTSQHIDLLQQTVEDSQYMFSFFDKQITLYFSFEGKSSDTLIFITKDTYDPYFDFLPMFISYFILFGKNMMLQLDSLEFQAIKLVQKDIEMEMYKKLKIYKKNCEVFQIIKKYFIEDSQTDTTFWNNFQQNLIQITSQDNQVKRDKLITKSYELIKVIFNFINDQVEKLFLSNKKDVFEQSSVSLGFIIHNCSGFKPTYENDIHRFGYHEHEPLKGSDILVLGFQEILAMKPKNLKNILLEDNYEYKNLWRKFLSQCFGKDYKTIYTKNILGLLLLVMVKKEVEQKLHIKIQKCDIIRLGALNLANKASIFLQISINYELINILNCHLASGTKSQNCEKRIDNINKILESVKDSKKTQITFIMGDLNFRNQMTYENAVRLIQQIQKTTDETQRQELIDKILETEELTNILKSKFTEIKEHQISFLPSYKYNPGTSQFDFQEGKRIPSHTDRILYIQNNPQKEVMKVNYYDIETKTDISDHKPLIMKCEFYIRVSKVKQFSDAFDKISFLQYCNVSKSGMSNKKSIQLIYQSFAWFIFFL